MNIVLANQWFPPESGWGGVGRYNHAIAHAYRELGHSVTIIASRLNTSVPPEQVTDSIRVRRLLVLDAYYWRRLPVVGRYVRPIKQLAYARRVDHALRELRREQSIDIVEFTEVNAESFFYARAPHTPFVVRCQTPTFVLKRYYDPREMSFDTKIISWCERDSIRRAHVLTAPSRDMAKTIANTCGVPVENIVIIPNALSLDEFPNRPTTHPRNQFTILHVGRLERAKGVTVLAQAIPSVARKLPDVRFVFVGDDRPTRRGASQRAELETQLNNAGVCANVEFAGAVDQATLVEWYRRADICVVPSLLYESFSYTCAQAMAAGKPVVASRIGGIPETVDDGVTGILATPGNVEELVAAIVHLARDSALRDQMGCAGREKVAREFDPIKLAVQNLQVYDRAIQIFKQPALSLPKGLKV